MTVLARVVIPHEHTADNYHEWVTNGRRISVDSLGRWNSRMHFTNATWWSCNNPHCAGEAWVTDAGGVALIDEAYESRWPRHWKGMQCESSESTSEPAAWQPPV